MTIIFDATTARNISSRNFGRGVLPSRPTYRADHTAADEAAYAAMSREEAAYNAHLDAMWVESARIDRLCRGPIF